VRRFYLDHNCRRASAIERRLDLIARAAPVSDGPALLQGSVITTRMLAGQLKQLAASVAEFDREIARLCT
jgi:hypothetical protein